MSCFRSRHGVTTRAGSLGAHHSLLSTYALETMVLYIFNMYVEELSSPLKVRSSDMGASHAQAAMLSRSWLAA